MIGIQKSANRMWKESGTSLSFKNWITREKDKFMSYDGGTSGNIIANIPLNQNVQDTLKNIRAQAGYQETPQNKTVFGINQTLLIVVGVLIVAGVAYKIAKSAK